MDTILNVHEVQDELDKAARDAKLGPADVRAGRFVHQNAMAAAGDSSALPRPGRRTPQDKKDSFSPSRQ